jgi:hypothetical protein
MGVNRAIRLNVKSNKTDPWTEPRPEETTAEKRRVGRVVHDERGNGSVEWVDVPNEYVRDTLRLLDAPLSVQQDEDTFNPYDRKPAEKSKDARPVKRDLRKLSEWIKTMRAVEEKKARGED